MGHETLYRTLNAEAKAWWYHAKLRREGASAEARKRERQSIRGAIENIRGALGTEGGHVSIGRGGCTIHYADAQSKTRAGCRRSIAEAAIRCGVPGIDSTTIPDSRIFGAVALPLVAVGEPPDSPPYGSLSRAPLATVAAAYQALGATLHNLTPDPEFAAKLGRKPKQDAALAAFASGDEMELGRLMMDGDPLA